MLILYRTRPGIASAPVSAADCSSNMVSASYLKNLSDGLVTRWTGHTMSAMASRFWI